jgi:hypothetical protein
VTIDKTYIDVDFTVVPDDQTTGLIEESDDDILLAAGDIGSFEAEYPALMVPQSKRKDIANLKWPQQRRTIRKIYSQQRTSACVGFGSAQALEITRTRRYGTKNHISLSGMSVYKEIGKSLMSGAMISDGMRQIVNVGALPLANEENNEQFNLTWGIVDWSTRFPSGWEKHASSFRVSKWATARGSDEIESALLNDFCGIVGRSRHCVPYVGLTWSKNSPVAAYGNSWSKHWGDFGIGYDSQRVYRDVTLYLILEIVVNKNLEVPEL